MWRTLYRAHESHGNAVNISNFSCEVIYRSSNKIWGLIYCKVCKTQVCKRHGNAMACTFESYLTNGCLSMPRQNVLKYFHKNRVNRNLPMKCAATNSGTPIISLQITTTTTTTTNQITPL